MGDYKESRSAIGCPAFNDPGLENPLPESQPRPEIAELPGHALPPAACEPCECRDALRERCFDMCADAPRENRRRAAGRYRDDYRAAVDDGRRDVTAVVLVIDGIAEHALVLGGFGDRALDSRHAGRADDGRVQLVALGGDVRFAASQLVSPSIDSSIIRIPIGDLEKLGEEDDDLDDEEQKWEDIIEEEVIQKRNARWLKSLEKSLSDDEPAMYVLGVGHMLGEKSLITMLEEKGFEVEQLSSGGDRPKKDKDEKKKKPKLIPVIAN